MSAERVWSYRWPGVDDTVTASSESAARAAIRAKHQLKWVPNGAQIARVSAAPASSKVAEFKARPAPAARAARLSTIFPTVHERRALEPPPAPPIVAKPGCCQACGRAYPKPKAAKVEPVTDLAAMTDMQRFAYFKRTAPVEDVRFALRVNVQMPDALRADWQTLLDAVPKLPRAEVYRRLTALQDEWRGWRCQLELERRRFLAFVKQVQTGRVARLRLNPMRLPA